MKTKQTFKLLTALAIVGFTAISCEKDDNSGKEPVTVDESKFVISTRVGDAVYLLTAESLSEGEITVVGQGTEATNGGSVWQFVEDDYLFSIRDMGGNTPAPCHTYILDAKSGKIKDIASAQTSKYHSWGVWGDNFVVVAQQEDKTRKVSVDGVDHYARRLIASYFSPDGEVTVQDDIDAENLLGTGESSNFGGYIEAGGKLYASGITSGVSKFALDQEYNADKGWDDYDFTGYFSSLSSRVGAGIPYPMTPDKAYISIYNANDPAKFKSTPVKILTTDKMGQAYGRYTSNPVTTIWANDEYVYVFSAGVTRRRDGKDVALFTDADKLVSANKSAKTMGGTKSASVMRIKNGETSFDSSYGTDGVVSNLDSQLGGCTFSRVWHISGDDFLLRVINEPGVYYAFHKSTTDAKFAIFNASTKVATMVTGTPAIDNVDESSAAIGEPYCEDGKAYVPIATKDGKKPAVYVIDAATATATKGLVIDADFVVGLGKLTAR